MRSAKLILDAKTILGEGAIWDAKLEVLYWVDIMRAEVHIYDPVARQDKVIDVGQYVGSVVPRQSGGLLLALQQGFASLDLETGKLEIICDPESHLPGNRFNDGKCDPMGRFWAGTTALDETPNAGSLYRLDADLTVRKMLDHVSISNGIVWSLDRSTMYYVDTPTRCVHMFDYDVDSGDIANRRVAIRVPDDMGYPDGMTLDSEGMLWVALWEGWCVSRWDPVQGALLQTIELPVSNVSSCAFGGRDLGQLYITTARFALSEQQTDRQPLAGGLFRAEPGVKGLPAYGFAG